MNISGMSVKNFRAHRNSGFIPFSMVTGFIGKNDSGKSSLLAALDAFFNSGSQIEKKDIYSLIELEEEEFTEIEVAFIDVPDEYRKLEILSDSGTLVLRRVYNHDGKLTSYSIKVREFTDQDFQMLWAKKEQELNKLGVKFGIDFTRSGRSITNEGKILDLRSNAKSRGVEMEDMWFDVQGEVKALLKETLPSFEVYHNESLLNTGIAAFQKPFKDMIGKSMEEVSELRGEVEKRVRDSINNAGKKIEMFLKEQTDAVERIELVPEFDWRSLASVGVNIVDKLGYEVSVERRGSGIRRLILVSYMRYVAEESKEKESVNVIYGIEEPETSLHPGAQRTLLESIKTLASNGVQVIYTTHSPIFVSDLSQENLVIIKREKDSALAIPGVSLKKNQVYDEIVKELGISSRDAILNYSSCIFVEGHTDITFFQIAWEKLKSGGMVSRSFNDMHTGFVPFGGDNLKFFVDRGLLKSINRRFAVIVDSDKKSVGEPPHQSKLRFAAQCQEDGGKFITLRKREIENYVHKAAYERLFEQTEEIGDFDDIKKKLFRGENGTKKFQRVIEQMSAEEFLERDVYGNDQHELVEIFNSMIEFFQD